MIVAAIVATGIRNEIGKNNQLLWHLPADLKFFKSTTMGHPVIMGRKTYESIGRLLPGRKNLIITRNAEFRVDQAEIHHSLNDALHYLSELGEDKKVFIIGGAEIYSMAMPHLDELYRTAVQSEFDADTFFPHFDTNKFELTWEECHSSDEKNPFDYCFQKWEKRVNQ